MFGDFSMSISKLRYKEFHTTGHKRQPESW